MNLETQGGFARHTLNLFENILSKLGLCTPCLPGCPQGSEPVSITAEAHASFSRVTTVSEVECISRHASCCWVMGVHTETSGSLSTTSNCRQTLLCFQLPNHNELHCLCSSSAAAVDANARPQVASDCSAGHAVFVYLQTYCISSYKHLQLAFGFTQAGGLECGALFHLLTVGSCHDGILERNQGPVGECAHLINRASRCGACPATRTCRCYILSKPQVRCLLPKVMQTDAASCKLSP